MADQQLSCYHYRVCSSQSSFLAAPLLLLLRVGMQSAASSPPVPCIPPAFLELKQIPAASPLLCSPLVPWDVQVLL